MEDRTNPAHYKDEAVCVDGKRYEPIDICECYNFCLGNAIKYIIRAKHHPDGCKVNYLKALWYLTRLKAQDSLGYSEIYPEGDGRFKVPALLEEYRKRFKLLELLLDEVGKVSLISIDDAIELLTQRISELQDE